MPPFLLDKRAVLVPRLVRPVLAEGRFYPIRAGPTVNFSLASRSLPSYNNVVKGGRMTLISFLTVNPARVTAHLNQPPHPPQGGSCRC